MVTIPFMKGRSEDAADAESVADETSAKTSSGKRRKDKPRKSHELLSSVIRESTPGAALDLVRGNEKFLVEGGQKGAVILLKADDIDGLSQKNRRDPNKGQIIEMINGDLISTLATEQMLADDVFAIIPLHDTLKRMFEFALLIEAPYSWALVDLTSEDLVISEAPVEKVVQYAEVRSIAEGGLRIEDALSDEPSTETLAAVPDQGESAEVADEAPAEQEPVEDPEDPLDLPADEDTVPSDDELDEAEAAEALEEDEGFDPAAELDDDDPFDGLDDLGVDEDLDIDDDLPPEDPEPVEDDGVDVGPDEVQRSLSGRILDEDLGLFVDLEAFDAFFQADQPVVGFELGEDEGWLGSQVAELRRQANSEIEQVHQNNVISLGQRYMDQVSRHSETVQKRVSLDTEDAEAYYGQLFAAAQRDLEAKNNSTSKDVADQQRRLREKFDEDREIKARAAAEDARARFNDLYGAKLDTDLASVGTDLLRANDAQYQSARGEILEMRRSDASRIMGRGVTRILDGLTEEFSEAVQDELDLHKAWNERILQFIDDNRKNDVARSEALAEQLRQGEQADQVRADYVAQIEKAREDRARDDAERDRRHESEIKSWQDRLAGTESELTGLLEAERRRSQEHREHADNLAERLRNLEPDVEKRVADRYETQLANSDANFQQASQDAERVVAIQRRSNLLMAILVPALLIVAVLVGILIGSAIFGGDGTLAGGAILLGTDSIFGPEASGHQG